MFKKYFYYVFVAVFLFSGCASKEVEQKPTAILGICPAKYIPANLLYGAGNGASPEGAKKRALANFYYISNREQKPQEELPSTRLEITASAILLL